MNFSGENNNFPVIGVGASAGGLEAFKELLSAIPADSGMAYVFVHISRPITKVFSLTFSKIDNDPRC
jgi:two-component system CheB/CheR fusion protein